MFEKFIEENIERDITSFETTDDLFKRYIMFCDFYRTEKITRLKFGNQIKKFNVGVRDDRKIKVGRYGVKLLPCKY